MQSADSEKVELFISCRKLKNMDLFSKSDPQVRLYSLSGGKWVLLGKTETINDNLNPNFSKQFELDFIFEIQQHLRFEVVDIDGTSSFDFIGNLETTLGKIMGAKKQTLIGDLISQSGKKTGKIIVRGEKLGQSQNVACWQWAGVKLMNTDGWFDKSDPLLRFFKKRDDGEWLQVHETEVIMNNLNPIWKMFEIKEDKLCGGDHNRPIRIECWDWENSGKYQYIGDCEITMGELKKGRKEFDLQNLKKKKKTGTLKLCSFSLIERPSFLQYIRGGEQLNVIVAIDFTGSNGHPSRPESLHARNLNGQMNQYQKAISAVCQILLNYDYDSNVPVFGFGGKPRFPLMSSTMVSHCFPCTGDPNQVETQGLEGILGSYDFALNNVELSGPTYFAPLLIETIKLTKAQKEQETGVYSILLILTDGEIHDMDQTVDAICNASHLPLSIIIVGVGNADFSKMEILDGDDGLYNAKGQKALRDLVQFVPFRNFNNDMTQLAKHVLAEIPDQLVEYMRLVGRKPKPPLTTDVNKLEFSSMATLSDANFATEPQQPAEFNNFSHSNTINTSGFAPPLNQQVLQQNPFLMNAGMHLIQGQLGMSTQIPQMQYSQKNPGYAPQQQQPQPNYYSQPTQAGWMTQQNPVTYDSFGMAQSTSFNPSQSQVHNYQKGFPGQNPHY